MATPAIPSFDLTAQAAAPHGATLGSVRFLLKLEGAAAFIAAIAAYAHMGGGWPMFLILFLVPDLSMAGYFLGRRVGAFAYNAVHNYLGPALLVAWAWPTQAGPTFYPLAAIWIAHIGLDRLLGFGLKYATGFKFTHLGGPANAPGQ